MKRRFKVVAWVIYETDEAPTPKMELDAETQFIEQTKDNLIAVKQYDIIG